MTITLSSGDGMRDQGEGMMPDTIIPALSPICSRPECQTTAGCAHRGPNGEYCYIVFRDGREVAPSQLLIEERVTNKRLHAENERLRALNAELLDALTDVGMMYSQRIEKARIAIKKATKNDTIP